MACPASFSPAVSASSASRLSRSGSGRPGPAPKIIDLAPYLRRRRRDCRQAALHTILAVWTQYLSLGCLVLYAVLRLPLGGGAALGTYSGPLALLWPASFFLLLTSYCSDLLLWREEWALPPEGRQSPGTAVPAPLCPGRRPSPEQ